MKYKVTGLRVEGILFFKSREYGTQIWVSHPCRKSHRCVQCGAIISVGEEAYRPLSGGRNRSDRICLKHEPRRNLLLKGARKWSQDNPQIARAQRKRLRRLYSGK